MKQNQENNAKFKLKFLFFEIEVNMKDVHRKMREGVLDKLTNNLSILPKFATYRKYHSKCMG